jgi:hypothetical protein
MYKNYYKYGFEHFINKNLLGLKKPDTKKRVFYLTILLGVILTGIMI